MNRRKLGEKRKFEARNCKREACGFDYCCLFTQQPPHCYISIFDNAINLSAIEKSGGPFKLNDSHSQVLIQ